jgi:DNA polymerase III epsilon subunit-like protein
MNSARSYPIYETALNMDLFLALPDSLKCIYGSYIDLLVKLFWCWRQKKPFQHEHAVQLLSDCALILTDQELMHVRKHCPVESDQIFFWSRLEHTCPQVYTRIKSIQMLLGGESESVRFFQSSKYNSLNDTELDELRGHYSNLLEPADVITESLLQSAFEVAKCGDLVKQYGFVKLFRFEQLPPEFAVQIPHLLYHNLDRMHQAVVQEQPQFDQETLMIDGVVASHHLVGSFDLAYNNMIIEVKASSKDESDEHAFQALLYAAMFPEQSSVEEQSTTAFVFNALSGQMKAYSCSRRMIPDAFHSFAFNMSVSTFRQRVRERITTKRLEYQTGKRVYVVDLETNSIFADSCDVIEITIMDYHDPFHHYTSLVNAPFVFGTEIHHITAEMIRHAPSLNQVRAEVAQFLGPDDVVMIAHNGNCFDFPILRRLFPNMMERVECWDSLNMIRVANGANRSRSLEDLFRGITGASSSDAHRATQDCTMLACVLDFYCIKGAS